jgi:hypothetical protein
MTKDELTEPLGCVVVRPLLANSTTPPAQPAPVQEPVALPCCGYTDASAIKWNPFNGVVQCHNCGQTYTPPAAQRQWVGLTEQERNDIEDYCEMIIGKPAFEAIEAKLKEKNNG